MEPLTEFARLARDGVSAFPPGSLQALAQALADQGERADEAWAFVAAEAVTTLARAWGDLDEESGEGLPTVLVERIDAQSAPVFARLAESSDRSERLRLAQEARATVREALLLEA